MLSSLLYLGGSPYHRYIW